MGSLDMKAARMGGRSDKKVEQRVPPVLSEEVKLWFDLIGNREPL